MRDTTSNLGAAIKAARKTKQLTQLELSEELGITPRHLQAIENGLTPEQEQLLYLIRYKCNPRDIAVLLSTAEALVNTKE